MQSIKTADSRIASYGVDWVFPIFPFLFAGFMASLFLGSTLSVELIAGLSVVLYLITVIVLQRYLPKIELFENGIQVTHNQQVKWWAWCEITGITGTRNYHSVNLFPIFRHGANRFYAGEEYLFSVSVLIINATPLVKYILIKMTECSISRYVARIENDDRSIDLGNYYIGREGVGNKKGFYTWDVIETVKMKTVDNNIAKILIKSREKKRTIRLAQSDWESAIIFMGLVDHFTGSSHLTTLASDAIDMRKRVMWWGRFFVAVTLIGIAMAIFFIAVGLTNPSVP